jgi:hypothetical protein
MIIFVSFSIEKAIIPYSYSVPLPHLTTCTATKYDSYLSNSLATVVNEPDLLWSPNNPRTKCHISFPLLRSYQRSVQARGTYIRFVPKSVFFRWGVVSTTANPQAGGPPLVVCPRLFIRSKFAATVHSDGRSSISNPGTRQAVVTGTHIYTYRLILYKVIRVQIRYRRFDGERRNKPGSKGVLSSAVHVYCIHYWLACSITCKWDTNNTLLKRTYITHSDCKLL